MKLLTLHIQGYGTLSNYDYSFDKTVSTFCESNGFGKTTIVSFITAMFFGLETVASNSSKFLDRKHFYPFAGGAFGGNITFLYNNKNYRIERTFDKTSEPKDTLTVYCNDTETKELGDNPGETIFGINKDSFLRLISISSDKIMIETDNDINQKLNNYIENVSSTFDIDDVINKFKAIIKENKKIIQDCKEKKKDLHNQIEELKAKETEYNNLKPQYEQLKLDTEASKVNYEKAANISSLNTLWETYDNGIKDINDKKQQKAKIDEQYPEGLPTNEQIKGVKDLKTTISSCDTILNNQVISDDNLQDYKTLHTIFNQQYPTDDELAHIKVKIAEHKNNCDELNRLKEEQNPANKKELESHFAGTNINQAVIDDISASVSEYASQQNKLLNTKQTIFNTTTVVNDAKTNIKTPLLITLLILSLAFFASGLIMVFLTQLSTLGIILILVGILCLIFDVILYINNKFNKLNIATQQNVETDNPEYISLKNSLDKLYNNISKNFAQYRYIGDNLEVLMQQLKTDYEAYTSLLKDEDAKKQKIATLTETCNESDTTLSAYFKQYKIIDTDFNQAYINLTVKLSKYNSLKEQITNEQTQKQEKQKLKDECNDKIDKFYDDLKIDKAKTIEQIEIDCKSYAQLVDDINAQTQKWENYKLEKQLVDRPSNDSIDVDSLSDTYSKNHDALTTLKNKLEKYEEELSQLDTVEESYQEYDNKQITLESKNSILDLTKNEIEKADQALKEKYIAPVKNKFCDYAKLIEDTLGEHVSMDKDYKISFDQYGALRSCEHLSSGNYAICALCFRLAILDNMFPKEKPFIIMDDPFVYLDAKHIDKTKELINQLSKDKQIIYLCCHESRNI